MKQDIKVRYKRTSKCLEMQVCFLCESCDYYLINHFTSSLKTIAVDEFKNCEG